MTDEKITLGEESPEENLSEILAVRRRKLADFRVFSLLQKTENFFLFVFFHNSRPFSPK